MKAYHSENKPVYCAKQRYKSKIDAQTDLEMGKFRVQALLQKARFEQLNYLGKAMGEVLREETRVANMPPIRVIVRPKKQAAAHRRNQTEMHHQYKTQKTAKEIK